MVQFEVVDLEGGAVSSQPEWQQWQPGLPSIKYEGTDAEARLKSFGLSVDEFRAAELRGHEKRALCTPLHPRTYAGQVMWAETVEALRTQLLNRAQGWKPGFAMNYETVFQPDKRIAIAVVGGDANTGTRRDPKTARRRGAVTRRRIAINSGQYMIPYADIPQPAKEADECQTWFFLINAREGRLHSELSCAVSIGDDARIGLWSERILLPDIEPGGAVAITPYDPDDDDDDSSGVHVDRRS